jgi:hypothetical protein
MTLRSTIDSLLLRLDEKQVEYGIKQKMYQSSLTDNLIVFKKSATPKDYVLIGYALGFITCIISLSLMGLIK